MQASPCVSSSFEAGSLNRYDSVRQRQIVRLRKRSDWFMSPTPGDGTSPGVMTSSQCPSLTDRRTPVELRSSFTTESSANPPSYSASDVPHVCINDSDMVFSETGPTRQLDEGYSSRSAVAENSPSFFPTSAENNMSSPATLTAANSRPNASLEGSPASAKHLLQSHTHYFLVDRFYGDSAVSDKAKNGDAC